MLGRLIPVGGGPPLLLLKDRVRVGRAPSNDVPVSCGSVSGEHCELELIGGYWWVRDLGSRNGTAVDNVRCQHSRIVPGSVLRLANQRFRIDYPIPKNASEEDKAISFLIEAGSGVDLSLEPKPLPAARAAAPSVPSIAPSMRRTVSVPAEQPDVAAQVFRALGKLVPCSGGDPLPLLSSPVTIGRSSRSDLQLKLADVSSCHCILAFEDGYWVVEDQQSTNGVRVNGFRVKRKVLFPDDRLSVASHRFIIHYVPQGSLPPSDGDTFSQGLLEKLGVKDSSRLEQLQLRDDAEDDSKSRRYRL